MVSPPTQPRPSTSAVKVALTGQIKSIKTVIDAVGDKVGTIVIEFRPEGDVISDLNKLQKPDKEIFAVIMEPVK